MQYPDDFKKKVLNTYNNNEELKTRMENGDVFVGDILENLADEVIITPQEIMASLESLNSRDLYAKAKDRYNRDALCKEWEVIYQNQRDVGQTSQINLSAIQKKDKKD